MLAWVTAVEAEFLHVWTISMGVVNWAMCRVVYSEGEVLVGVSMCMPGCD